MALVVLDPGHGMGNKKSGVFDPGAIGLGGAREADWALSYAGALEIEMERLGLSVLWTRGDNTVSCPLRYRVSFAEQVGAGLLLSLHFNADATPGDAAPDGRVKGFEVLYRNARSKRFAEAIAEGLGRARRKAFRSGVVPRNDLYVLRYEPSVLIEWGFLDDPEDFSLIADPAWRRDSCRAVAAAVKSVLDSTP